MRPRKGLSPLVATVVLISVTVLGGLLIYAYFQQNVDTMLSASQTLLVRATSMVVNANSKLVYVEAVNSFDKPIDIVEIDYITVDGAKVAILKNINVNLGPGEKYSNTVTVNDPNAIAIIIKYRVDGKLLESEPINIKK